MQLGAKSDSSSETSLLGSLFEAFVPVYIEEYKFEIEGVRPGRPGTGTFVADEAGVFSFYSNVGNNKQHGMEGFLIVTE